MLEEVEDDQGLRYLGVVTLAGAGVKSLGCGGRALQQSSPTYANLFCTDFDVSASSSDVSAPGRGIPVPLIE